MAKKETTIQVNGVTHKLTIHQKPWFKTEVYLDDNLIGHFSGYKSLLEGQRITLDDGSILEVKQTKELYSRVSIARNGQELNISDKHPQSEIKLAIGIVYSLGGLNLLLGSIALFNPQLLKLGFGIYNIILGGFDIGLIYLFSKSRSVFLLSCILFLFIIDMVLAFIMAARLGVNVGGAVYLRMMFIVLIVRGIRSAYRLNKTESNAEPGKAAELS